MKRYLILSLAAAGIYGLIPSAAQETEKNNSFTTQQEEKGPDGGKGDRSLLRIVAGYSDNIDSFDPMVIYYDYRSTYNFDSQYDALKIPNTDQAVTNFYVFSNDARSLSISAIPYTGGSSVTLRLGIKTDRSSEVVIRIRDISGIYLDKSVVLKDQQTGAVINLNDGGEYRIFLLAGDYQQRFYLTLSDAVFTGIEKEYTVADHIYAYSSGNMIRAEIRIPDGSKGFLSVFSASGQLLFAKKIEASGDYEIIPFQKSSIYIVRFTEAGKAVSVKVPGIL